VAISQVSDETLLLTWTAPGDDAILGQAAAYDLRVSSFPITALNFDAATTVAMLQTPVPAGETQRFVVTGLSASTRYYFALKTRDEASNWSLISNVPTTTTREFDSVPPAAIEDLSAGP
jgi:chitodextrinase